MSDIVQLAKLCLEDFEGLLNTGFDSNVADCKMDGVKDTILELKEVISSSPDGTTWLEQNYPDLMED